MSEAPGRLLARGRAADVFDLGDGTVLRRYRVQHDSAMEADIMKWVGEHGYPVPAVVSASGTDIVMERIDGPTMLDDLGSRPWKVIAHARTLARLQRQLARLPDAPDWIPDAPPPVAAGSAVLHLDLHPMNVILSDAGPVVIDWTNAGRGAADFDAAYTYALMAAFEVTSPLDRAGRWLITRAFRLFRGRAAVRRHLVAACDRRIDDVGTTPGELRAVEALRERALRAQARRRRSTRLPS